MFWLRKESLRYHFIYCPITVLPCIMALSKKMDKDVSCVLLQAIITRWYWLSSQY